MMLEQSRTTDGAVSQSHELCNPVVFSQLVESMLSSGAAVSCISLRRNVFAPLSGFYIHTQPGSTLSRGLDTTSRMAD